MLRIRKRRVDALANHAASPAVAISTAKSRPFIACLISRRSSLMPRGAVEALAMQPALGEAAQTDARISQPPPSATHRDIRY
jgi:hypothetical protein